MDVRSNAAAAGLASRIRRSSRPKTNFGSPLLRQAVKCQGCAAQSSLSRPAKPMSDVLSRHLFAGFPHKSHTIYWGKTVNNSDLCDIGTQSRRSDAVFDNAIPALSEFR